ncbi:unnamed protein product [Trichogramma brassicae]|uniref:PHD finger-like domain-containing protein 5A n=1 Tax=Trichogramma brassicae TaxID=86971 RepID=A0A6H5IGR9_9HYME|nr:unnamed protein product [Trichogramma brassicae]
MLTLCHWVQVADLPLHESTTQVADEYLWRAVLEHLRGLPSFMLPSFGKSKKSDANFTDNFEDGFLKTMNLERPKLISPANPRQDLRLTQFISGSNGTSDLHALPPVRSVERLCRRYIHGQSTRGHHEATPIDLCAYDHPHKKQMRTDIFSVDLSEIGLKNSIGRLCEKCDGKCVICDSYVRPCTLVRICDECNYGSYQGRCVICGGPGVSDAYYCKECTIQEKDRDGCPKIVNLGSSKTDLFYERKKYGFKRRYYVLY